MIRKYKPVSIPNAAFIFCRYTLAIIIWLGFFLRIKGLIVLSFLILLFSAWFKIKRAPLIFLYSITLNKIVKSKDVVLDEKAMRFVHSIGAVLSLICVILLYTIENLGWAFVLAFAILKTISAIGVCPASKLYNCMSGGKCCAFVRKK